MWSFRRHDGAGVELLIEGDAGRLGGGHAAVREVKLVDIKVLIRIEIVVVHGGIHVAGGARHEHAVGLAIGPGVVHHRIGRRRQLIAA